MEHANPGQEESEPGGTCGALGQLDDERIRLMGLVVRTHRLLTDRLGRELEDSVTSRNVPASQPLSTSHLIWRSSASGVTASGAGHAGLTA